MKVTIENFRCYTRRVFEVEEDFYHLNADSGQGKTTLFEAIYWCLYGKSRKIASKLFPNRKTTVKIEWRDLVIERKTKPNLLVVTEGETAVYQGEAAQSRIDQRCGEHHVFLCSGYLKQQKVCFLLDEGDQLSTLNKFIFNGDDPSRHLEIIEREVNEKKAEAVTLQRELERAQLLLDGRPPVTRVVRDLLRRHDGSLASLESHFESLSQRRDELLEKITNNEDRYQRDRYQLRRMKDLLDRFDPSLEEKISSLTERLESLRLERSNQTEYLRWRKLREKIPKEFPLVFRPVVATETLTIDELERLRRDASIVSTVMSRLESIPKEVTLSYSEAEYQAAIRFRSRGFSFDGRPPPQDVGEELSRVLSQRGLDLPLDEVPDEIASLRRRIAAIDLRSVLDELGLEEDLESVSTLVAELDRSISSLEYTQHHNEVLRLMDQSGLSFTDDEPILDQLETEISSRLEWRQYLDLSSTLSSRLTRLGGGIDSIDDELESCRRGLDWIRHEELSSRLIHEADDPRVVSIDEERVELSCPFCEQRVFLAGDQLFATQSLNPRYCEEILADRVLREEMKTLDPTPTTLSRDDLIARMRELRELKLLEERLSSLKPSSGGDPPRELEVETLRRIHRRLASLSAFFESPPSTRFSTDDLPRLRRARARLETIPDETRPSTTVDDDDVRDELVRRLERLERVDLRPSLFTEEELLFLKEFDGFVYDEKIIETFERESELINQRTTLLWMLDGVDTDAISRLECHERNLIQSRVNELLGLHSTPSKHSLEELESMITDVENEIKRLPYDDHMAIKRELESLDPRDELENFVSQFESWTTEEKLLSEELAHRDELSTLRLEVAHQERLAAHERFTRDYEGLLLLRNKAIMVQEQYVDQTIAFINASVNSILERMFDEPIRVVLKTHQKRLEIDVSHRGAVYSIWELSFGERDRISLAFFIALNNISSCPFVLIDETMGTVDDDKRLWALDRMKTFLRGRTVLLIHHGDDLFDFKNLTI